MTHITERIPFYEPPEALADTVFDPYDETFGPIMAKIKRGEFVDAARDLLALERRCQADRLI